MTIHRDFTVSFTVHPIKGDLTVLTDSNAITQSIKNLVYTGRYERFWHPMKGAGIPQTLFENAIGVDSAFMLESRIREVISNYEPRADVKSVQVAMQEDRNEYVCTIIYAPINSTQQVQIDAIFKRVR